MPRHSELEGLGRSENELAVACLAHNNKTYLEGFIMNMKDLKKLLDERGIGLEVVLLDSSDDVAESGERRFWIGGIEVLCIERQGMDMVAKIREGCDYIKSGIVCLWTLDDYLVPSNAVRCFEEIKEGRADTAGGCRVQIGERFTKLSKLDVESSDSRKKLKSILYPYEAYIYFLSRKSILWRGVDTMLKWTQQYSIFEYANYFEIGFCIMTQMLGRSKFYHFEPLHLSSFRPGSLGGKARDPFKCSSSQIGRSFTRFLADELWGQVGKLRQSFRSKEELQGVLERNFVVRHEHMIVSVKEGQ